MKIYALHNNTGSRFYRLIPMLKKMQSIGHEVVLEPHSSEYINQMIEWCDVVIFQMVFSLEHVKRARALGKKIIFECDDLIHSVPKGHYSYESLRGLKGLKMYFDVWRVLRQCDAFIATTKNLARTYGWMSKKSFVFENYVDLTHWLKQYQVNTTGRIRILWAGSTSHTPDLEWIRPTMDRILRRHPEVQFIYVGHGGIKSTDKQAKFVYGDDIFEGLPDNRESMLSVPSNVWPYVLSSLQADLAIAPLQKNYFNKFKSQCKYLEYGLNKLPGVYARWHYSDVQHGKTGYLADTPEEFEAYLELLISDKAHREAMGEAAFDDVLTRFDMRAHVDKWIDFVKSV